MTTRWLHAGTRRGCYTAFPRFVPTWAALSLGILASKLRTALTMDPASNRTARSSRGRLREFPVRFTKERENRHLQREWNQRPPAGVGPMAGDDPIGCRLPAGTQGNAKIVSRRCHSKGRLRCGDMDRSAGTESPFWPKKPSLSKHGVLLPGKRRMCKASSSRPPSRRERQPTVI